MSDNFSAIGPTPNLSINFLLSKYVCNVSECFQKFVHQYQVGVQHSTALSETCARVICLISTLQKGLYYSAFQNMCITFLVSMANTSQCVSEFAYEVLTVEAMKVSLWWNVTRCTVVDIQWRFEEFYTSIFLVKESLFYCEGGVSRFSWNAGKYLPYYTA
jgi:hypothetical protein